MLQRPAKLEYNPVPQHYPNLKVDVTHAGRYKARLQLNGFEAYHIETCKKYGLKFNPKTIAWEGNIWVVIDLLLPLLGIVPLNLYIDPVIKNIIKKEETDVLLKSRIINRDKFIQELKTAPLKGKSPYENFQIDTTYNFLQKQYYGVFLKQGTGKSWIIASALHHLLKYNKIGRAILLTPGSGLVNLKRAILKFTDIRDEDILLVTKNNRDAYEYKNDSYNPRILISTYSSFRLSEKYYNSKKKGFKQTVKKWLGKEEGCFVLDEGHYIGNPSSQQSSAIHSISDMFKYRMISTGTPADKPDKYYSLLKFLHPYFVRYLGFTDWKHTVANIGTSFSAFAIHSFREEDLRYFIEASSSNYINLKDTDVLELPEHYFKPTFVQLDELHKDLYEAFNIYQLSIMKDLGGGRLTPYQVFNKFPYMLLSIDNPSILTAGEKLFQTQTRDSDKIEKLLKRFKFEKHHGKLEVTKELLTTHIDDEKEQVVIWTGHPLTANELAETFKEYNPLVMHGQTKVDKGLSRDEMKDKVVQQFINNKKHKLLIASYYVLDTAVDIVNASAQIFFDLPYMFSHFDQAYKRLHRHGQIKTVNTYILIFANSLDELRYRIVSNKQRFDSDALNTTMPLEDWKALFSGKLPAGMTQDDINKLW